MHEYFDNSLREYYKALCFSGIYSSAHRYGYSGKLAGAMYAIGEIRDAIPVIHGSSGCGFHYRYVCRRDYLPVYNAQCTELEEKDIVFGGADKLRSTILETARRHSPAMIAVIPSTSVDMIHDEMNNVVESLRGRVGCRLVALKSEKFSHADKRDRKKILEQRAKNWDNPDFKGDFDFKGCGFVEAMKAMVGQVMEKQEVEKNAVNICGLAWGAGGSAITAGMAGELKELGIGVNAYLPNCTTREVVEAPRAELNIVTRRIQWAEKMEGLFGTAFFHINSFDYYRGLDGIERLYLKISEALDARRDISKLLSEKKRRAREALKPAKEYLKGFCFALYTSAYRDAPHKIIKYEEDFGISLKYVCVEMRRESLELDRVSGDDEKALVKNIRDALAKTGSKAQLLVNAAPEALGEAFGGVDYVIGGGELGFKPGRIRYVQEAGHIMPLDFQGFGRAVADFARRVKKAPFHDGLIIEKFKYQPGHYPMLKNSNLDGARRMWESMWLQRGCGG